MTRISVVGCSGAGKTTVAKRLSEALGCAYIELDALHWGPGWSAATEREMTSRVREAISGDSWVVDGNYHSMIGTLVWDRADVIVWVDPPRWRVMLQAFNRCFVRGATRQELWNGNRESLAGLMFWRGGEKAILRWAWDEYPRAQARYSAAMSDPQMSHLNFRRLRTRSDGDALVRSLAERGG